MWIWESANGIESLGRPVSGYIRWKGSVSRMAYSVEDEA